MPPASCPSFTIRPTRQGGFTDQLFQFGGFYRLGRSLGYTYRHTPFCSPRTAGTSIAVRMLHGLTGCGPLLRSWCSNDIYGFLGFNAYLESISPAPDTRQRKLKMKLSDRLLAKRGVTTFHGLQEYVAQRVASASRAGLPTHVTFALVRGTGRQFLGMIHDHIPDIPDGLDLRRVYFSARQERPWPSPFHSGAVRTVVHIRQGDTAVVRTPGGSWIRLPGARRTRPVECADFDEVGQKALRVEDFQSFLAGLFAHFDDTAFSTLVFSDGFERAFRVLRGKARCLHLPRKRTTALLESQAGFDEREFAGLNGRQGMRTIIGEGAEKLRDLVHATLTASLVITGPQQKMLPKLLSSYCRRDTMPLVIALERGINPGEIAQRYLNLGIRGMEDRFIYANVDQPDYQAIVETMVRALPQLNAFRRSSAG